MSRVWLISLLQLSALIGTGCPRSRNITVRHLWMIKYSINLRRCFPLTFEVEVVVDMWPALLEQVGPKLRGGM